MTTEPWDALTAEVWQRVKAEALGRVITLTSAVRALRDSGAEEHRVRAVYEAHRLAGALGSFGYAEASAAAARVEAALGTPAPDRARVLTAEAAAAQLHDAVAAAVATPP